MVQLSWISLALPLLAQQALCAPATTAKTTAKATATTAAPAATSSCYTLNFDNLGASGAHSRDLPSPYKGFNFGSGQWGFASVGTVETFSNYDVGDHMPWNVIDITARSGKNAIVNYQDAGGPAVEPRDAALIDLHSGSQKFDLKSFWIRGEYPGAFVHRLRCDHTEFPSRSSVVYTSVPALTGGAFYQIKLNSTFTNMWRCAFGADDQQILLDDISVCTKPLNP